VWGQKWPGWPFGVDKQRNEAILLNDDGSEGRVFRLLLRAIPAIFTPGTRLIAESLCLRQQLLVLQRGIRGGPDQADRRFWILASRWFGD
jgi:hypothetical protein